MKNAILELKGISKKFGPAYANQNINVQLKQGEFHAIVGENGAGKSTLIKMLSGVHLPDEGEIYWKGNAVKLASPHAAQSQGISTLFQEIQEIPALSVAENIFLGREPKSMGFMKWSDLYKEAEDLLRSLNIKIDSQAKMEDLRISERKMVEIARAVSIHAELIIMDEPSANLNEDELKILFDTIALLRKQNVTIVYISHRLREIFAMADRVTVLRDGKHIQTIDIADTNEAALVTSMIGRQLEEYYPAKTVESGSVLLDVNNLGLSDGELRNVSFQLRKREIVGLAGLAGSGQELVTKILFGLIKGYTGNMVLDGRPFLPHSPRQSMNAGISFVPEDRKTQGLFLNQSVKDNMSITALAKNFLSGGLISKKKELRKAQGLITQLSVRPQDPYKHVGNLSGGNQQKALIGRWLIDKYKILILEEPTRGVDVGAKMDIYQEINKLLEQDLAILMVSSELPELLGMCDRILVFSEGKMTAELSRDEATEEKIMEYAFPR
ncbi:sugar ABC transporter ATP-binding protein [Cohnella sp. JJ-181]|uniref:sugar ABC transporter ATP-binding protein n=1 Tax=Cohnella rhizoplanae TaxID=2974897 RepID=UPI0022FF7A93|nr:sugar ABC transporter ATP-binding protein [Cohnella sp. JJ-181]CAI6087342.1 Ribose import ATP-binding protein RbsA [Cohnella sp. JJ-181]